jgi:hypothetical protein
VSLLLRAAEEVVKDSSDTRKCRDVGNISLPGTGGWKDKKAEVLELPYPAFTKKTRIVLSLIPLVSQLMRIVLCLNNNSSDFLCRGTGISR